MSVYILLIFAISHQLIRPRKNQKD
jgi:hypothetical protein